MAMENFTWSGYDANQESHQVLQGFLVLDIQYSVSRTQEVIQGIKRYLAGDIKEYAGTGNGYEFSCETKGFEIDCLHPDDAQTPVTIEYSMVLLALKEWQAMCAQREHKL